MKISPGQVYLVDLGMVAKVRPMLVVSREDERAPRALVICAPITSSNRGSQYEVSIGKPRFLDSESFVNVQGLQAIQYRELQKMIGQLPLAKMTDVKDALKFLFELESNAEGGGR